MSVVPTPFSPAAVRDQLVAAPDDGAQVHVRSDARGTGFLVTVTGDLDASTAPVLATVWVQIPVSGVRTVRIDLLGVRFCNAAGLRALALVVEECRSRGVGWELVAAGLVARCLTIVGLATRPADSTG